MQINDYAEIVKPKFEVPKSKVPKSRPKGLGLTLKSHVSIIMYVKCTFPTVSPLLWAYQDFDRCPGHGHGPLQFSLS